MANGQIITNTGKNLILKRLFQSSESIVSNFRYGAGTTTPTDADTTIETQLPFASATVDACDATTGWAESGIGDAVALNTTAGEFKEGTGALNLPTTGAAGTATWQKTQAGFDLNDAEDTLFIWLYINASADLTTSADAVRVTLGTGGYVNTHYWSFADTTFSDGWNLLILINGAQTGTEGAGATLTNIDRTEIAVKLDTDQSTNDMRMDFWHLATASDFKQGFISGYPVFDTANRRVTIRATLNSTQGNGHLINEVGFENTDSTIAMLSRTVHTVISKSSKDDIIYQNIYSVV